MKLTSWGVELNSNLDMRPSNEQNQQQNQQTAEKDKSKRNLYLIF